MNTDRILTISANAPLATGVSGNESTSVKSPKETISAFPKQYINYSQTAKVLLIKHGKNESCKNQQGKWYLQQ